MPPACPRPFLQRMRLQHDEDIYIVIALQDAITSFGRASWQAYSVVKLDVCLCLLKTYHAIVILPIGEALYLKVKMR